MKRGELGSVSAIRPDIHPSYLVGPELSGNASYVKEAGGYAALIHSREGINTNIKKTARWPVSGKIHADGLTLHMSSFTDGNAVNNKLLIEKCRTGYSSIIGTILYSPEGGLVPDLRGLVLATADTPQMSQDLKKLLRDPYIGGRVRNEATYIPLTPDEAELFIKFMAGTLDTESKTRVVCATKDLEPDQQIAAAFDAVTPQKTIQSSTIRFDGVEIVLVSHRGEDGQSQYVRLNKIYKGLYTTRLGRSVSAQHTETWVFDNNADSPGYIHIVEPITTEDMNKSLQTEIAWANTSAASTRKLSVAHQTA